MAVLELDLRALCGHVDGDQVKRSLVAVLVALALARDRISSRATALDLADILGGTLSARTIATLVWEARNVDGLSDFLIIHGGGTSRPIELRIDDLPPKAQLEAWRGRFVAERRRTSGGWGSRQRRLGGDLDFFEHLVSHGRFADAHRFLRDNGLRRRVSRDVSGAARARLGIQLDRQMGGLLMQEGSYDKARKHLQRAADRARDRSDWINRWYALGNLAAAFRMEGASGVKLAAELWSAVLDEVRLRGASIDSFELGEIRRWSWTSYASPLLIQEAESAGDATLRAIDLLAEVDPGRRPYAQAEARLRQVRWALNRDEPQAARDALELARRRYGEAAPLKWLDGWFPRYEADVALAEGDPDRALDHLHAAWRQASGFGFQRLHLVARLKLLQQHLPSAWPKTQSRRFTQELSHLHRQFVGTSARRCSRCGGRRADVLQCIIDSRWADCPASFFF